MKLYSAKKIKEIKRLDEELENKRLAEIIELTKTEKGKYLKLKVVLEKQKIILIKEFDILKEKKDIEIESKEQELAKVIRHKESIESALEGRERDVSECLDKISVLHKENNDKLEEIERESSDLVKIQSKVSLELQDNQRLEKSIAYSDEQLKEKIKSYKKLSELVEESKKEFEETITRERKEINHENNKIKIEKEQIGIDKLNIKDDRKELVKTRKHIESQQATLKGAFDEARKKGIIK